MNKRLSNDQVAQFRELGYVKSIPVLDGQQVAKAQSKFVENSEVLKKHGLTHNDVNGWWAVNRSYWEVCMTPAILDCLEDLLGPNLLIWGGQYFAKMPGDGKTVPWHQDAQYWPLHPHEHCVSVWIALYDTDTSNGCMQVIPGTHKTKLSHEGDRKDTDVLEHALSLDEINIQDAVDIDLKAGEMSLHSDALVHGSGPNGSDRLRCGITMRVSSPDVKADLSVWPFFRWIQLRGDDPFNNNPKMQPPTQNNVPSGYNQHESVFTHSSTTSESSA